MTVRSVVHCYCITGLQSAGRLFDGVVFVVCSNFVCLLHLLLVLRGLSLVFCKDTIKYPETKIELHFFYSLSLQPFFSRFCKDTIKFSETKIELHFFLLCHYNLFPLVFAKILLNIQKPKSYCTFFVRVSVGGRNRQQMTELILFTFAHIAHFLLNSSLSWILSINSLNCLS